MVNGLKRIWIMILQQGLSTTQMIKRNLKIQYSNG